MTYTSHSQLLRHIPRGEMHQRRSRQVPRRAKRGAFAKRKSQEGAPSRRDSPAPKASGCPRPKAEPRRGRKGPSDVLAGVQDAASPNEGSTTKSTIHGCGWMARSNNKSHWSSERAVVVECSPTVRANCIRVGRSPFSCRGHLTRTEGSRRHGDAGAKVARFGNARKVNEESRRPSSHGGSAPSQAAEPRVRCAASSW